MAVDALVLPASLPRPAAHLNGFSDLLRQVKDAGLMRRRYGYYWSRFAGAAVALGSVFTGVVLLGDSWLQLVLAAVLGLILAQLGFLGHEASHRQIFRSASWNDWSGRVLSAFFAGISHGWWMNKHSRHHGNPNKLDADPDIRSGAVAFSDEASHARRGVGRWLVQRQGWFFLPLLTLEGLSLHVSSVRHLLSRRPVRHRGVELTFLTVRFVGYLAVIFWLLPPGLAFAFVGVQVGVFGFLLGGAFAPNHIGMSLVPREVKIDFLRRQVLTSRNITGGPVVRFLMGGLDLQVEHHLFPGMARPNLRQARELVRRYCDEHRITYTETTLLESYGQVLRYLNEVGLGARNKTFVCPMVAQLR
ncbi:fatty acid desaturase family protein [uncultured Friedmanniella sp.]|uniref:fatty acid desaturase family protein n=1 Tax=uncultured Friedmanniella sp. TaxID=335381 RepID=UPI0035CA9165